MVFTGYRGKSHITLLPCYLPVISSISVHCSTSLRDLNKMNCLRKYSELKCGGWLGSQPNWIWNQLTDNCWQTCSKPWMHLPVSVQIKGVPREKLYVFYLHISLKSLSTQLLPLLLFFAHLRIQIFQVFNLHWRSEALQETPRTSTLC